MKRWLVHGLVVAATLAACALVWFAGPLIGFGEVRPFETTLVRAGLVALIVLVVATVYAVRFWRARRAARALEAAIVDAPKADDGGVLAERLAAALARLNSGPRGKAALYELPWYVLIGPPGAGKTTALANSGLSFAKAGDGDSPAVSGVGGTRYCDWWFAEEAVLIDTAGRYTTQDSDAEADKASWLAFLRILKENRARQPINGVVLVLSLEDLMTADQAELSRHAAAVRRRLGEIAEILRIEFPVYALFTKGDLVSGFGEFFGAFPETRRRRVWGATFQGAKRGEATVGRVPEEMDALVERLTQELPDRLQDEADPVSRIAVFGFPAQVALLKPKIAGFLDEVFKASRFEATASLRGFYLCSGTQEGTPIDQMIGALGRGLSTDLSAHMSGRARAFFLHDLLKKVIFEEAGWVSYDRAAARRSAALRWGAFAAIGLASLATVGLWWWSFGNNRALVASVDASIAQYREVAPDPVAASTISDPDYHTVLTPLHTLRFMPTGYEHRGEATPLGETFGLSVRDRLASAAQTSYRTGLERMFRSRIILRLERQIEENIDDPIVVYEALKVYLMLGGKAPRVDRAMVETWLERDWNDLYPGPSNRGGREELRQHLDAMLDLAEGQRPSFDLNDELVTNAQRTLARMKLADRAYALVKSGGHGLTLPDLHVDAMAGQDAELVFQTTDGSPLADLAVPALFTYGGFHGYVLPQMGQIADQLMAERWVMGDLGLQDAVEDQIGTLGPEILGLYRKDFVAAWESVLSRIELRSMSADKPQYTVLAAVAAPTSPLRMLVESVARETALTKDREGEEAGAAGAEGADPTLGEDVAKIAQQQALNQSSGLARIGLELALSKSQRRARPDGLAGGGAGMLPGADIEATFKMYADLVEGTPPQRPIDVLVGTFADILQSLSAAQIPSQASVALGNLQLQVASLKTAQTRVPPPIRRMVVAAAGDFEGDVAGSSKSRLETALNTEVTRACQQVVSNRYPFSEKSDRDVPMGDFSRLFGPGGILDKFFAANLVDLVDTTGEEWRWNPDNSVAADLDPASLRDFQRAAEIREAFFGLNAQAPAVQLTITPNTLSGDAEIALLSIDDVIVESRQVGNQPAPPFTWPGPAPTLVRIDMQPLLQGRPSSLEVRGPWAFMRLLDLGGVSRGQGDSMTARFVIGGREVSYRIDVGSVVNPFRLPALRDFRCPAGF